MGLVRLRKNYMLENNDLNYASIPSDIRTEVTLYSEWLNNQSNREDDEQERYDYALSAKQAIITDRKTFVPFVPFHENRSALKTITLPQRVLFVILGLLLVGALLLWHWQALSVVIGVIIVFYLFQWMLNVYALLRAQKRSSSASVSIDQRIPHYLSGCPWPSYTILCPLYKEGPVVAQFVKAMERLDYPTSSLQILLLTEEDDNDTRLAISALGTLPPHFQVVTVPKGEPRTKPRACNYGLMLATGRYVVIYDAEDIPEPTQLKQAILTFAQHGPDLACVQAQLNFYNTHQNLLTRLFTIEYSLWFDLLLPALQHMNIALPLGGTSNHFRTSVLRVLGGWDAFNVTEDADLGMRLSHYHFQTAVLRCTTYEEANSDLKNWIRQRSRWIKGYMQTYLVQTRHPVRDLARGRSKALFSIQVLVGGAWVTFLLNPVVWIMLFVYILFRSHVENVYHILFPAPILYAGMLCLLFGNFYYLYIAMLSCMQRKQYTLVKWCLLLPFYWLLMSVAAIKASWQLITKPHYWEKTQHGLHLKDKRTTDALLSMTGMGAKNASSDIAEQETAFLPSISASDASSVTEALKFISTQPTPAVSVSYQQTKARQKRAKVRDVWVSIMRMLSFFLGILVTTYFFHKRELLLIDDATSRLRIARSVFDNVTPGLAQLGSVWLPLPQVLLIPFVSIDYLWHTGLAGAFVSIPCYVIATVYIFLLARKIANSNVGGVLGASVFLLNPNILYLQSTPLTELVCIASIVATAYHFYLWMETQKLRQLIISAIMAFLSTLIRYDGWAFSLFLILVIIVLGFVRKEKKSKIVAHLLIFAILPFYGMLLWFGWNQVIWGDFLYFQRGEYSAQTAEKSFLAVNTLPTYHSVFQSIRYFSLTILSTVGIIVIIAAALALLIAIFKERRLPVILLLIAALVPSVFYIFSLYTGQIVIYIPSAVPPHMNVYTYLFNVRYGVVALLPICLLIALLAKYVSLKKVKIIRIVVALLLFVGIGAQSYSLTEAGAITLQDARHGLACAPYHQSYDYIARHYDGGKILESMNAIYPDATEAGLDFKEIVYQGSGDLWKRALNRPESVVDWIIFSPNDLVATNINKSALYNYYTLMISEPDGVRLYHKNAVPVIVHPPPPSSMWTDRKLCPQ
jgi:cellulose synthase/poly-beta-1,6-N-acetylglucosamine synthase-like glycosyltransferase